MKDMEAELAIRMIDKIYKDLYKSEEVLHNNKNVYNKFGNIKSYINRLERIHNKVKNNDNFRKVLKNYYYAKYVIKPENIKESCYKYMKEAFYKQGKLFIEYDADLSIREIISNQKNSLDVWLDYFLSDDSDYIPMWAKFWSFQGMVKLGTFDKTSGRFNKRDKYNTSEFVDLNREVLALSIDFVRKILNKEEIDDKDLEVLVKSGSFRKIYGYLLNQILKKQKRIVNKDEGIWIKYKQGSDHLLLVASLQGYNTGWCTVGEATAKSQLSNGDFYIYYTKDENGDYKIPRIAIRMVGKSIREIRGVARDQNIEPSMEEVVRNKIKEFPDNDKYYLRLNDMQYLAKLDFKQQCGEKFSIDDLRFLYEVDNTIQSFGYIKDPRIEKIKRHRSIRKDLASIFECLEDEVALTQEELFANREKIIYLFSDLITKEYKLNFPKLKYIKGNVYCDLLSSAEGFGNLKYIGGTASFDNLTSAIGFKNLQCINGNAYFPKLESLNGLDSLQDIKGVAHFNSIKSINGLEHVNIFDILDIDNKLRKKYFKIKQKLIKRKQSK